MIHKKAIDLTNKELIRRELRNLPKEILSGIGMFALILLLTVLLSSFGLALTVDFNTQVGTVPAYFYGITTGQWGTNWSFYAVGNTSTINTPSNKTFHQQKINETRVNFLRADMYLQHKVEALINGNMENWIQDSLSGTTDTDNYPFGWRCKHGSGGNGFCQKSIDSHTGLWSTNISNIDAIGSGKSIFIQQKFYNLTTDTVYNISVWTKSNNATYIAFQRQDTFADVASIKVTGNGNWQNTIISYNTTTNEVPAGWAIIIKVDAANTSLIDDVVFYENNTEYFKWKEPAVGNHVWIGSSQSLVEYARSINAKVLFIADYMPDYLANVSAQTCRYDTIHCPPYNYTKWGQLVVDFLNKTTNDGTYSSDIYVEVWNEPCNKLFWMNETRSTYDRTYNYLKLFNATETAIRNAYPNIKIGNAPNYYWNDAGDNCTYVTDEILQNITPSRLDFISHHEYSYHNLSSELTYDIQHIQSIIPGKQILFSEFNDYDEDYHINKTNRQESEISRAYSTILNNYPTTIISMNYYHWMDTYNYSNFNYWSEYPKMFSLFQEQDNKTIGMFNIIANYTLYHRQGSTIFSAISSTDNVTILATTNGTTKYVTITNDNIYSTSVPLTISGLTTETTLKEVNSSLTCGSNVDSYPIPLTAYEIRTFTLTNYSNENCTFYNYDLRDLLHNVLFGNATEYYPTNFSNNLSILIYYGLNYLNTLRNNSGYSTPFNSTDTLSVETYSNGLTIYMNNGTGWWNQTINGKTINLPPNGLYAYITNDSSFEECFNCDNTSTYVITSTYIYLYPKNDASITFNLPSNSQEYTIKRFYGDDSINGLRTIDSVRASTYTTSNAEILYPVNVALPLCLYSIGGNDGTSGMSSLFGALALVICIVFIIGLITKKIEFGTAQSWLFVGAIVLFMISMVIFSVLVNICA